MNPDHIQCTALIAMPRESGNIATPTALVDVFKTYKIGENLGFVMLDNATNNDTAIESIQEELGKRTINANDIGKQTFALLRLHPQSHRQSFAIR